MEERNDDAPSNESVEVKPQNELEEIQHKLATMFVNRGVNSTDYVSLLIENCSTQQNWHLAWDAFRRETMNQNVPIELDANMQALMERMIDGLFFLRFMRQMIAVNGLIAFEERIMNHLIDSKFAIPTMQSLGKK